MMKTFIHNSYEIQVDAIPEQNGLWYSSFSLTNQETNSIDAFISSRFTKSDQYFSTEADAINYGHQQAIQEIAKQRQ